MTIKTVHQAFSSKIKAKTSDMQKRGAVRNCFGTTVNRDELQQQLQQLENENNQTLQNYRIIGVIGSSASYLPPRKKRFVRGPGTEDESDDNPPSIVPAKQDISSDEPSSSPSSSSSSIPKPLQTSSTKKLDVKLIQQTVPLPKGKKQQKTLKDYFPIIKRTRQQR